MSANQALNLTPFSRWTLRDKGAQRRLALRSHQLRVLMIQKMFITLFLGFMLSGCATSQHISTTMSDDELSLKIKSSPIVHASTKSPVATQKDKIEFHYFNFNAMNSPSRIINWEYYYKIGELSEPQWSYHEIGDIELWIADKEDEKNIELLRSEASKYGADAVIELYRKPINTSKQNAPPYGPYAISEFGIGGYLYYGKLVKKK